METFYWILAIVAAYFLLVFVALRLVVPYMGFRQYQPPTSLPQEMKEKISELEAQSPDQKAYLDAVYKTVSERWQHSRFQAALQLPKLFRSDLEKIWHVKGFAYCSTINFVIYTFLANSKFFKTEDIKVKHVFLNFVPHQYLQVKVGERWIDIDPAGAGIRGLGIGHHASIFG